MLNRPEKQPRVRHAAVAGLFYPAEAAILRQTIERLLQDVSKDIPCHDALIAPHAGYIYSGITAAHAYVGLLKGEQNIKRVILLGPAHRVYTRGLALSTATYFETPLGGIEIDRDAIELIKDLPQVIVSDQAHAQEHSLEVHLPFLQCVLKTFKLVPLVVGEASADEVMEVIETYWGDADSLIIVSTDLSHYHDYETARRLDKETSRLIETLQYEAIGPEQACGCRPLNGLLHLAREKDLTVHTLDLRNSGDTAGTKDRVVGYGAYGICAH